MDKYDRHTDWSDDVDEVEILEVVGVEDDETADPRLVASVVGEDDEEESSPDEFVIDFDGGQSEVGASSGGDDDHGRLLRLRADYDNLRKRIDREREEFEVYANFALVGRLLPVLDNLERALVVDPTPPSGDALREGLVMIHRQLTDELRREGLRTIDTVGHPFDPNLHDAVATDSESDLPSNTVVEELQRGYLFENRVLRPAMVRVSMGDRTSGGGAS